MMNMMTPLRKAVQTANDDKRNFLKWATIAVVFCINGLAATDTLIFGHKIITPEDAAKWTAMILGLSVALTRSAEKKA